MNQMRNISVKSSVLESLAPHLSARIEGNRYHLSYAVWQLARMGAYNEAGELPLAIRLEATGDFTELYLNRDRLVCPVDIADVDIQGSDIMLDALVRCAIFLIRSRRDDMVDFLIMISSKQAETAPVRLSEWENPDRLTAALTDRLQTLKTAGVLREETDIAAVIPKVLNLVSIEYARRRHGYLGEDALWGRELDAVKVLEDAGIEGSDLAGALANLVAHAACRHVKKRKTGMIFSRADAMLMIRDYQRRARIQRPGVRVIDLIFMEKQQQDTQLIPRIPGWKNAADPKSVRREVFDSAVKWARLAALKSGRGLLPVFFFTGEEGNGRSFLLKQIAWELYKEGFPVAEIIDLEEAAREAEGLATAAVALDAPLILVWDDALGPGQDGIQALKEFSEAQLSGVPMMILAAASDAGYNPKKVRQISRTSFEEFEIHGLDSAEMDRIAMSRVAEAETVESGEVGRADSGDSKSSEGDVASVSEEIPAGIAPVELIDGDSDGESEVEKTTSIEKLQEQKTDEFTIMVSRSDDVPKTTMLEAMLSVNTRQSLEEYAGQLKTTILNAIGEAVPVFDLICSWNIFGMPLPEKVARQICGDQLVTVFKTAVDQNPSIGVKTESLSGQSCWDFGHPLLVRTIWGLHQHESLEEYLGKTIQCVIQDLQLQPLAGQLVRSVFHSKSVSSQGIEMLTGKLISMIKSGENKIQAQVLADLFQLASTLENEPFQTSIVDTLADSARQNAVDSYIALTPLLRTRLGGIEDVETLEILNAAKPDIDRIAFKFLLKFLGDHQPNDLRDQSVENARTAAARSPDHGFAVAAYLRFCWARGTEEQIARSIEETRSWLAATPDDRVVRRAFVEHVISKGSEILQRESIEPLEDWLTDHMDEGPMRNSLIELAFSLNDPGIGDRVLDHVARWIEKRGNNRSVRQNYFRRAEKRNDQAIMQRACEVAVSWLNNHSDDRETVRSLLFIAGRLGESGSSAPILGAIHTWINAHVIERDILRRYLLLADRGGRGRSISHAVEIGLKWIEDNPQDLEIREMLLGMTARKVDRKLQIRVYDSNIRWLEAAAAPNPALEYMIGRLGVRAGIARRAIPLLERTVARSEGELRNHARLWLGSAYRVAEAYIEARKVWQAVKDDGDVEMAGRAERNLESLEALLKERFPKGYPPPEDRPVRKRPQGQDTQVASVQPGSERVSPEMKDRKRPVPPTGEQRSRPDRDHRGPRPEGDRRPPQRTEGESRPGSRPDGDRRPPKRFKDAGDRASQKPEQTQKAAATLGDLFRMKGLDLSSLTSKEEKPGKKQEN